MLYRLSQQQLKHIYFPLHALQKDEVREIALRHDFACAKAPDSQEICFVPDNDYAAFIEKHFGACKPGRFIAPDGSVCGTHKGILHYTVGQRKGLGIALGRPVFVREIDPVNNAVYLGEINDALYRAIVVEDLNLLSIPALPNESRLGVKIRSVAKEVMSTLRMRDDGLVRGVV